MIFVISIYQIYTSGIDTKYAIKFSQVLQTYDIDVIDAFFSENTLIICNEKASTYRELRDNIVLACNEKLYRFDNGSSYGHGNDRFPNGVQTIMVHLFGELNNKPFEECTFEMVLKKVGVFSYEIESIKGDFSIFEYLFFGIAE